MNNFLNRLSLLVIFSLSITPAVFAQQDDLGTLTLDQSIEIAQDNSPVSRANRYALVASRWEYKSFQADLFPSLSLSGDAPNYNKSIFTNRLDDGTLSFVDQRQSDANVSLSVNQTILPTGGEISLSSGLSRLGIFRGENTYRWWWGCSSHYSSSTA